MLYKSIISRKWEEFTAHEVDVAALSPLEIVARDFALTEIPRSDTFKFEPDGAFLEELFRFIRQSAATGALLEIAAHGVAEGRHRHANPLRVDLSELISRASGSVNDIAMLIECALDGCTQVIRFDKPTVIPDYLLLVNACQE